MENIATIHQVVRGRGMNNEAVEQAAWSFSQIPGDQSIFQNRSWSIHGSHVLLEHKQVLSENNYLHASVSLWGTMPFPTELPPRSATIWCRHAVLVESHPFCTTLDLQLSFYRPMCNNSRLHCPLLQCLRTTSAILAGAHSYFVVSSLNVKGNSFHDLIPNPLLQCLRTTSAILAGAHSYFVVWSFKCEGK